MRIKKKYQAQTFLEYVLMITVITAIMIAMSTTLRRSVQGMVKVVADQVGFQQNAEQKGESGYLKHMNTLVRRDQITTVKDRLGNVTYFYDKDQTESQTFVLTNLGYSEN